MILEGRGMAGAGHCKPRASGDDPIDVEALAAAFK